MHDNPLDIRCGCCKKFVSIRRIVFCECCGEVLCRRCARVNDYGRALCFTCIGENEADREILE